MTETDNHATGRAFLIYAADYLRGDYLPKIERCLERLTDTQIWWRANEESNSIGNLILHLCGNATQWILSGVGGRPDNRDRDSEFERRDPIPRAELSALLVSTVTEVDHLLRTLEPEVLLEQRKIQGKDVVILDAIFHVTEHFSMHTGQIIMLTKMFTTADLRFYDFEAGVPVERWQPDSPASS